LLQLGKYQLVAEIARGGMGIVYLAVAHGPARFSKLLVVKELKPELVDDPTFLEMFLEEARLAARLSHPNIVQTYEIGAEGRRHFIVMDYLEGVTLARVLRKKSDRFTLPMQLRVICDSLQGLHYAHTLTDFDGAPLGIVHRDATPQNLFITFDGQVKIVDFGIAKALDSTIETRTGVLKGKPAYMAPEQVAGDVDPRADIFGVGVMIWEAAAGRRMWHKKGDVEVLTNIIKGTMPSLKEIAPDAPEALVRIVERAMAKNRDERYPSAADLQADLEAYLISVKIHITARDVAAVVAELFADERAATRSTIEQHLKALQADKPPEKLPSLHPPAGEGSTTPSGQRSSSAVPSSGALTPAAATPSGQSMPATPEIDVVLDSNRPGRRGTAIFAALGVISLLVVGGVVLAYAAGVFGSKNTATNASREGAPAASTQSEAAATPTPTPVVPAAPATHEIDVKVTPSSATVAFDGVNTTNPAKKTCNAGQHMVMRVSANGFLTREREITCDKNESLELSLQPIPFVAPPPPPPPPRRTADVAVKPPDPVPTPVPPSKKVDCNPPFYFEGTKKMFKPGCI
jgi:serine/threonine-protein kinase